MKGFMKMVTQKLIGYQFKHHSSTIPVGCYLPNGIDVGQLNTKGTKDRLLNR